MKSKVSTLPRFTNKFHSLNLPDIYIWELERNFVKRHKISIILQSNPAKTFEQASVALHSVSLLAEDWLTFLSCHRLQSNYFTHKSHSNDTDSSIHVFYRNM